MILTEEKLRKALHLQLNSFAQMYEVRTVNFEHISLERAHLLELACSLVKHDSIPDIYRAVWKLFPFGDAEMSNLSPFQQDVVEQVFEQLNWLAYSVDESIVSPL